MAPGNSPQHLRAPTTSFSGGVHTLTVQVVDNSDQITIYRGALEAPVTCGALRAVERLIQLDDRPSLKRMKERMTGVARMPEPAAWSAIDSSNWRNARMPVEEAFWRWVVRPPKK